MYPIMCSRAVRRNEDRPAEPPICELKSSQKPAPKFQRDCYKLGAKFSENPNLHFGSDAYPINGPAWMKWLDWTGALNKEAALEHSMENPQ